VEFDSYRGAKVNLIWMIPISQSERDFIMEKGSTAFIKELNTIGEEIFNLDRIFLK